MQINIMGDSMDFKKLTKEIKELKGNIKTLEEENSRRKNQYVTIFRDFKKVRGRIGYLESQSYTQKEENEKHFTHLEDELIAIQSTLDFFTCDPDKDDDTITGHEEVKEEKEETKEEPQRMIMGVNFSDAIIVNNLLPKKTKTK